MNIYRDSALTSPLQLPANATFQQLTTSSLNIMGSTKGDILIVDDDIGTIGGLGIGPQNSVVVSNFDNTGKPAYTNALTLNKVTTTELNIPDVQTGDILVGAGSGEIARVPTPLNAGLALQTDGGAIPVWSPVVIPDPLELNNLTVNNKAIFNGRPQFTNGFDVTQGISTFSGPVTMAQTASIESLSVSNFIFGPPGFGYGVFRNSALAVEAPQIAESSGSFSITTTDSPFYSFPAIFEIGGKYKVTLSMAVRNSPKTTALTSPTGSVEGFFVDSFFHVTIGQATFFFDLSVMAGNQAVSQTKTYFHGGSTNTYTNTFYGQYGLRAGQTGTGTSTVRDIYVCIERIN